MSNSSPLIWLSKINRLSLLRFLFGEVAIPEKVKMETASGQSADSISIKGAVEEGWVKVSEEEEEEEEEEEGLASALAKVSGIHLGEAEAILLARRLDARLLVDERGASATAQVFGVRSMGTVGVLLLALAEEQLTLDEFEECLDL
ncbi:MAG TPA: DUF3368 domain-containing protein, partial [Candidatus Bathyarchaeia archaeon]